MILSYLALNFCDSSRTWNVTIFMPEAYILPALYRKPDLMIVHNGFFQLKYLRESLAAYFAEHSWGGAEALLQSGALDTDYPEGYGSAKERIKELQLFVQEGKIGDIDLEQAKEGTEGEHEMHLQHD